MAILYVDDGGSNTSPFDTIAKACTGGVDAALADAACVAGSTVYVGHDSVYTAGASITYNNSGTLALPIRVISADLTGGEGLEVYASGAIEDVDLDGLLVTFEGHVVWYGMTIKADSGITTSNTKTNWFYGCSIQLNRNAARSWTMSTGATTYLFNSNMIFVHAGSTFLLNRGGNLYWYGGTLTGAVSNLISPNDGGSFVIEGVDLSAMIGGGIVNDVASAICGKVSGCKLNATAPAICDAATVGGVHIEMFGCNSGNAPYFESFRSEGSTYHNSSVYRAGVDPASNNFSAKMVSNANASYHDPLRFKLADRWCSANPTIKVHCTHDVNGDVSDLQNDEFWLEIEYPTNANAAYRQWDRTSKMAVLGTPADLTTEGSAGWTSSQNVDNSISETISGGAAGVHTVWVCLARASKTVYVCPQLDVT